MAKIDTTTAELAQLINLFSDDVQAMLIDEKLVVGKGKEFSITLGDIHLQNFECKSDKLKGVKALLNKAAITGENFSADISFLKD